MTSYSTLLEQILPTLIAAGNAVMEVYNGDIDVTVKEDASPVTIADERGEAIITAALNDLTPDILVIGEEAKSSGSAPELGNAHAFWLVDPLDGTKEFIKKGNDFTVNIGLVVDGMAHLGLVLAPATGQVWAGIAGEGAWTAMVEDGVPGARKPIHVRPMPDGPLTIVASKSHRSEALEAWLAHYPDAEHVSIGSSLKFCLLAEGRADIYPRLGPTCEWDTAAAHAVLCSAGGAVLTAEGEPLRYGKDNKTFLNPYFLAVTDANASYPAI